MDNHRHHPLFNLYRISVVVGGLAVAALAGFRLIDGAAGRHWLILAALAALAGSFSLKLPGVHARISAGDTFICANLVLFGPAAGTVTAALDGIFGSLRCKSASRRVEFALFNTAAMALSSFAGGHAFAWLLGGENLYRGGPGRLVDLVPALALLALVYYGVNSILVAIIIALEDRKDVFEIWRDCFLWTAVQYVAAASIAGLVARSEASVNALVVVTILAVVAAIYASSRSWVGLAREAHRLRDENALLQRTLLARERGA